MPATYSDHFSPVAKSYADYRPTYPPAMFDWLSAQCAVRNLAWDVGAGTGQASIELAKHFTRVLATDASAAQIAQAQPQPNVDYLVSSAEISGLDDRSVDLITVAQALHWFDLDSFYREVKRVLKPTGVLAAWTYGILHIKDRATDEIFQDFYHNHVGAHWPPERRHVENAYRDLAFPFKPIHAPSFNMTASWTLEQLLGYIRTWSATTSFIQTKGFDPIPKLAQLLASTWLEPSAARVIQWPLSLRVGHL